MTPQIMAQGPAPIPSALFLDAKQAAVRYSVSIPHWRRMVDAGRAPQPVRLGRVLRWALATLQDWEARGCPRWR